jgi:5-deoxy-D-glucuronate isomerase
LKKVITAQLVLALIIIALTGCAGNSVNDNSQNNQASASNSVANSATTSISYASNSSTHQVQSSTAKTSAASKSSVSEDLNALNSNGQSIENMLKGIANDNADISISDIQSNDAASMANQLNSYLNPSTDNISGLN